MKLTDSRSTMCPSGMDSPFGLVVKASAKRAEDQEFESCLGRHFSGSDHTSDLKIGTARRLAL